ncbi:MAG: hypothetical protein DLM62_05395 [Pseudonocardiales bacterium]|nr:MAG: hypothetical protein DLM62_05395 [Pseudonocardiales bacterium]
MHQTSYARAGISLVTGAHQCDVRGIPSTASVSALHEGTLVRAVHVVSVSHEVAHCFIEFWDTATITVHDDPHALSHRPDGQIWIEYDISVTSCLHEEYKAVVIVFFDRL